MKCATVFDEGLFRPTDLGQARRLLPGRRGTLGAGHIHENLVDQGVVGAVHYLQGRQMVIRAVQMAVWQRQGCHRVILHSDRGSQFRSGAYQRYLVANGLACSMSAVDHCGDNAACEGFFGLLKRERIYRSNYPTLDAANTDVFEYNERFHNTRMQRRVAREDQKFSALLQPSVILR